MHHGLWRKRYTEPPRGKRLVAWLAKLTVRRSAQPHPGSRPQPRRGGPPWCGLIWAASDFF